VVFGRRGVGRGVLDVGHTVALAQHTWPSWMTSMAAPGVSGLFHFWKRASTCCSRDCGSTVLEVVAAVAASAALLDDEKVASRTAARAALSFMGGFSSG